MAIEDSITRWLHRLKTAEDQDAAQRLWDCYYDRLVRLARKKLGYVPRRIADEEDVALSAFHSFCWGLKHGHFAELHDRDDLWRILVVITARKAFDQIQRERRQKRGGGSVRDESAWAHPDGSCEPQDGAAAADWEHTPHFSTLVADEFERTIEGLRDETLKAVVLLKLQGYTHKEIADILECAVRTVERKLRLIRDTLTASVDS